MSKLNNPNAEGYTVVRGLWKLYYNQGERNYIAPKRCNGTYDDHKFVVWPIAVASQAVVDGARIYPELKPLIPAACEIFFKYKNQSKHAYSATENKDNDIYYDDNAQIASCLITAYEVTGNPQYLAQGRELVDFLMTGWNNDPKAATKGGMLWHISKSLLNACTTAEVAKACLQLSRFVKDGKRYIDFAIKCIQWQFNVLQDPSDKLIMDGVGKGETNVSEVKYSYNLGTTLTAASHIYQITKDEYWLKKATELAEAGINRNVFFYDRDFPDHLRYWRDGSYFNQLLIEGLADYLLYCDDAVSNEFGLKIQEEIKRHLIMFYEFMKDPKGGLYIQSFEPHNTYKEVYDAKYKNWFGDGKGWGLKGEDKGDDGNPQYCLMGLGAAARVFFQGARVAPNIDY
ncbi:unnamed protein product [Candida verbasci]|uniref:Mannan endo-1,6-alpha-mannosidase n=1 Tax=Candida verbasci TaxID=1227364 RepID=A0A9W4XLZ8_9ASCO|nr:unnamed protein product [Candida verbasci]